MRMQAIEPPISIDTDVCVRCGLCAKDCPLGVIVVDKKTGSVGPHKKRADRCFNCGHCMAICPTGAIRLSRFEGQQAERVKRAALADFDAVKTVMSFRRSVRSFKDEALPQEELQKLLDVTAYAPSGHNERKVRWAIAATPEAVQRVGQFCADWMQTKVDEKHPLVQKLHLRGVVRSWRAGHDLICRNAAALSFAYAPVEGATPREDAVIATSYLELAASAAGLGACWAGYVNECVNDCAELRDYLGIPEGFEVHGTLMLGYPDVKYSAVPPRELNEIQWIDK